MRSIVAVGIIVALAGACVPAPALQPAATLCPSAAPAGAGPYWPLSGYETRSLAGRYELVSVTSSHGPPESSWRGILTLVATDSLFHPIAPTADDNVPWLAGNFVLSDSALGTSSQRRDTVEVVSGRLYLGCRHCNDGSPVEYRIIAVTSDGFWGYWEDPQSGFAVTVDSGGRILPNPAGRYCAQRRKAPAGE